MKNINVRFPNAWNLPKQSMTQYTQAGLTLPLFLQNLEISVENGKKFLQIWVGYKIASWFNDVRQQDRGFNIQDNEWKSGLVYATTVHVKIFFGHD